MTEQGWIKQNSYVSCTIFRTGLRVTHLVLGTMLVTQQFS